jgi:UDP-3-O-acyl-N-acetylglucosamine deacetylase
MFEGKALHSGEAVTAMVLPSSDGLWFQHGNDAYEAIPSNVTDTSRCTVLGSIRTIEHLMSAFAALGITDARVELSYPELPGMDGSSVEFWKGLNGAGLEDIGTKELNELYTRLYVQVDDVKIAVGKGTGHWRFEFMTGSRWPGEMSFDCEQILEHYGTDIAPARTTVFSEEIDVVRAAGLGQGLDESSVLILGVEGYENAARFEDEPARHKLLDLVGDLYLSGFPIDHLNVVGSRSGHRRNVEMAQLLFEACR